MNVCEACCLLHTAPGSADDEIKKDFRVEASRWHPDRGGDHIAMCRITEAKDYLLHMTQAARLREWSRLKRGISEIMMRVDAESDAWEARRAAKASPAPAPAPTVTNKSRRRAAGWEARNADRVREQTAKRVKAHRARDPEQYREYMREYMKNRRRVKP